MIWGFLLHGPVRRVLVAGFWAALVLVGTLTLLPAEALPPELFEFDLWDKVQHALAFTVLGLWGLLVYPLHPWRVLLGLLCFGGAIEVAQAMTTWRFAEWHDWLADTVGLALGAALAWWPRQRIALALRLGRSAAPKQ